MPPRGSTAVRGLGGCVGWLLGGTMSGVLRWPRPGVRHPLQQRCGHSAVDGIRVWQDNVRGPHVQLGMAAALQLHLLALQGQQLAETAAYEAAAKTQPVGACWRRAAVQTCCQRTLCSVLTGQSRARCTTLHRASWLRRRPSSSSCACRFGQHTHTSRPRASGCSQDSSSSKVLRASCS